MDKNLQAIRHYIGELQKRGYSLQKIGRVMDVAWGTIYRWYKNDDTRPNPKVAQVAIMRARKELENIDTPLPY